MIAVVAIGVLGGLVAGLMGVGGGIIFVPGLVIILGLTQQQAEATSLLAIVPVAIAGAISHDRDGDVRRRDGTVIGLTAAGGVLAGVVVANSLSGQTLRDAFAVLLVVVAAQLARDALRERRSGGPRTDSGSVRHESQ